jgi:hypothetical protein
MTTNNETKPMSFTLADAVRHSVTQFVDTSVSRANGILGHLDRWSRRHVVAENLAKTNLMLEADDAVEHCYQNLIREIDCEAEMGVLLANATVAPESLRLMCDDPGVSGELFREMDRIAPTVFPDEYAHSDGNLDLVWASVQALYDRAYFDATTSELAMTHFLDSAENAADMVQALRSLFYSFYEEGFRRQFDLSSLLDEPEARDLFVMVADLMKRAGSYEERIKNIQSKTETH